MTNRSKGTPGENSTHMGAMDFLKELDLESPISRLRSSASDKTGYWLTSIWLRHWHAIRDLKITIPFGSGLHLEGDTGAGKTTILDAVQWALIGDNHIARFNRAASSRETGSGRTVLGYVRFDEHGTHRRERGTAYTLLEFYNQQVGEHLTVGCIIDYQSDDYEPRFLIATLPLTPDLITNPGGQIYTARDFEALAKKRPGSQIQVYRQAKQYRDALVRIFEGLPLRFFETISHLSGQHDPNSLNDFIREYLFEDSPTIDLGDLREQVLSYREAEDKLEKARARVGVLDNLKGKANEWQTSNNEYHVYRLCEFKAEAELARNEMEGTQKALDEAEEKLLQEADQQGQLETEKNTAWAELQRAQDRRNLDQRSQEIRFLTESKEAKTGELNEVSKGSAASKAALHQLHDWAIQMQQFLAPFSGEAQMAPPVELLQEIVSALDAETPDVRSVQIHLNEIQDWAIRLQAQEEAQLRDWEARLREAQQQIADLAKGLALGWPRAYRVRDELRRQHGQVEVLCDLVDWVDPEWQPVIERRLGGRRYSLVTTAENYRACLNSFLAMPDAEVDDLHLANPQFAFKHAKARRGSLAEKVRSTNPIAQGLLNYHLNNWTTFEDERKAVESTENAVVKRGIFVSGGTIQRQAPLPADKLVFGRATRERQRDSLVQQIELLTGERRSVTQRLQDTASLVSNIKNKSVLAGQIRPDLVVREARLLQELAEMGSNLTTLLQTTDFMLLEEAVNRASAHYETIVEQIGSIKTEIEHLKMFIREKTQLFERRASERKNWEEQITSEETLTSSNWLATYMALMEAARNQVAEVARSARSESDFAGKQIKNLRGDLGHQVNNYITQFCPPGSVSPVFEDQLDLCLREHASLRETQVKELAQTMLRLRSIADETLLRKFFERLRTEHKKIGFAIRDLNRVIEDVTLGRRRYQFVKEEINVPVVHEVLKLMRSYDALNAEQAPDLTAALREAASDGLIDKLYSVFIPPTNTLTADDVKLRDILLSPANYFIFDLQVSEDGGEWFGLSENYRKGSGGEHQNPLYVVLLAAMLQLYERHPRRLRLVLMDEAFNKAPGSSINGLEILLSQGLQPLVATPMGRPEVEEVIGYSLHVFRDERSNLRVATSAELEQALSE